jgi:hypothetical protein
VIVERKGPGLVKSRPAYFVEQPVRRMVRCSDYLWSELFKVADVVSEGAIRIETAGPIYYGSTHIRLPNALLAARGHRRDVAALENLMHLDPHLRVRALRVARLEAQIRSGSDFESVRSELTFANVNDELRISVDIEAVPKVRSTPTRQHSRHGRPR